MKSSLTWLLNFFFGCSHQRLSNLMGTGERTYQVCLNCGCWRFLYLEKASYYELEINRPKVGRWNFGEAPTLPGPAGVKPIRWRNDDTVKTEGNQLAGNPVRLFGNQEVETRAPVRPDGRQPSVSGIDFLVPSGERIWGKYQ